MDGRGRLAFVPLGDPVADRLLAHVEPERRADHWHLVTPDGRDLVGGAGLVELLAALPWPGALLAGRQAAPLLDVVDRLLGRWRGRLGRFVPDVPGPRRFP